MKIKCSEINDPLCDYITVGKEYEIIDSDYWGKKIFDDQNNLLGGTIISDDGHEIFVSINNGGHIKGDWEVIE